MTGSSAARFASIASTLALVVGLGGCAWISSWFTRTPKPVPPAAVVVTPRDTTFDAEPQPTAVARVACTNYAQTVQAAPFPREAIIRGIDAGNATVRFLVDGTTVTVISVRSSDPAFGNAAGDLVRTLTCRVERPTTFEAPFSWRTVR